MITKLHIYTLSVLEEAKRISDFNFLKNIFLSIFLVFFLGQKKVKKVFLSVSSTFPEISSFACWLVPPITCGLAWDLKQIQAGKVTHGQDRPPKDLLLPLPANGGPLLLLGESRSKTWIQVPCARCSWVQHFQG